MYQPDEVTLTGLLHPSGGLLIGSTGFGQGFSGKAPEGVELLLAFTQKPDTTYHHRCRVQCAVCLSSMGLPI